jgi:hypothetical protein
LDSLGAINIRRTLAREINTGGAVIGNNVVFEYSSQSCSILFQFN